MWFGGQSPYMGMLSGAMGRGAAPMTPGAGMPPQGNAPMNMQMPQMPTPQVAQSNVPVGQPQQGQQPANQAQMGMLAQMLQQRTQQPTPDQASAAAIAAATGGMVPPQMMGQQAPPQQQGGAISGLLRQLGIL